MTILNTYQYWHMEPAFCLLVSLAVAFCIFSVIAALAEEQKATVWLAVLCIIASLFAIGIYNKTERIERHKIYANELTYSEILEKYNIIETEGLIITVEEKEPSAQ